MKTTRQEFVSSVSVTFLEAMGILSALIHIQKHTISVWKMHPAGKGREYNLATQSQIPKA
jgi:hypothetical protein